MYDIDKEKRQQQITCLRRIIVTGFLIFFPLALIPDTGPAGPTPTPSMSLRLIALIFLGIAESLTVVAWMCLVIAPWVNFSLRSFLIAVLSLNACLALILAAEDLILKSAGYLGIVIWVFCIGVGLLHHGVVGRFRAAEQKHFDAKSSAPKE
jgi:hypothetical protein